VDFGPLNNAVLDVFGDSAQGLVVTIGGAEVRAIYDSRHFADEEGEAGTSDLITTITVPSIAAVNITDDTIIVARGNLYRRFETRPDGQGLTTIALEKID
jgi:hypothetical protein